MGRTERTWERLGESKCNWQVIKEGFQVAGRKNNKTPDAQMDAG